MPLGRGEKSHVFPRTGRYTVLTELHEGISLLATFRKILVHAGRRAVTKKSNHKQRNRKVNERFNFY